MSEAVHAFERTRTVLMGEDDGSSLIFFPMYYHYMSEAEQHVFAELGHAVWSEVPAGMASPVVHSECDYVSAVRAGDELTHRVQLELGRTTSMTFHHEFLGRKGETAALGRVVRVWVDLETMEKRPIPAWLREMQQDHGTRSKTAAIP